MKQEENKTVNEMVAELAGMDARQILDVWLTFNFDTYTTEDGRVHLYQTYFNLDSLEVEAITGGVIKTISIKKENVPYPLFEKVLLRDYIITQEGVK